MIRGTVISVLQGMIQRISATCRVDETLSNREFIQDYGFTSRPKPGAEVIFIREGNHFIAIASDDRRYRIALEEGEIALYDDLGQIVHLTRDGIVASSPTKISATAPEITLTATSKVLLVTPTLEVTGSITAGGNVSDVAGSMVEIRTTYNAHTHPVVPGVTQTPTQVMS